MGHGQFLTQSEQQQLKQARIEKKQILQFKIVSTQLRMTNICRFHIPASGTLQDIYQEFNSILMVKFAQKLPAEQLANLL